MWASDLMRLSMALIAFVPGFALAETPMTGTEFEAFVTGKTLDFANESGVFGTEEYLLDRRVRWAATDETCKFGRWFEADGQICFVYEDQQQDHCWIVWQRGDRLVAQNVNDAPDRPLRDIFTAKTPLTCEGPDVGV